MCVQSDYVCVCGDRVTVCAHCSGSIDGTSQLIIKGKFQQKQIETVLRRYISESLLRQCCVHVHTHTHTQRSM